MPTWVNEQFKMTRMISMLENNRLHLPSKTYCFTKYLQLTSSRQENSSLSPQTVFVKKN